MTETTDPPTPPGAAPREPATARKPRLALFIATAGGLGYLKPGPGTWGSLLGLLLTWLTTQLLFVAMHPDPWHTDMTFLTSTVWRPLLENVLLAMAIGLVGVWCAGTAERSLGQKDPQILVIDEVSGQQITLLLGGAWYVPLARLNDPHQGLLWDPGRLSLVNWKYLLLGFILFRVFDIWKPFPVRQAEKLPGGWGIMADDWVAAIYAAAGLWIARALGL
jgi:phosphatidylglycerophosphatase A